MSENKNRPVVESDTDSILNTNSSHMAEQVAAAQKERRRNQKQLWKSIGTVALAVALVLVVVLGGGIVSDRIYKKQQAEEEARACRDGFQIRYGAEPELTQGEMTTGITEIYYSQENGVWVTLMFANGYEADSRVDEIGLVIKNVNGERIASAASTKIKDVVVPAGGTKKHKLYLEPQVVTITDDTFEKFSCDITLTDVTETTKD